MYFVLRYDAVVDDYVNRRAPFRAEHLRLLREAHQRGEVLMAGAVGESPDGAIIIFRSESAAPAERFVAQDPYVTNGLILSWRIQPWNVVIGGQLFSKSFLGYTTYKMGFATREGLLPAILILVLPFVILAVLVRILPPWAEREISGQRQKA